MSLRHIVLSHKSHQSHVLQHVQDGLLLESGETLKCDVLIYATGYETGFGELKLLKDGEVVNAASAPRDLLTRLS